MQIQPNSGKGLFSESSLEGGPKSSAENGGWTHLHSRISETSGNLLIIPTYY